MEMKLASTFLKPAGSVKNEKLKLTLNVLSEDNDFPAKNSEFFEYELFVSDEGMYMVGIRRDGSRVTFPEIVSLSFEDNLIAISSVEWIFDTVDGDKESGMTVRLSSLNDDFKNIGLASARLKLSISKGFFQDPKTVVFRAIGIGDKRSIQAPDQTIRFFKETNGLENDKKFTEYAASSIEVKNGKISDELMTVTITREDSDSKVNTGDNCKRLADDKELSDLTDRFIDRIFTFLMTWN